MLGAMSIVIKNKLHYRCGLFQIQQVWDKRLPFGCVDELDVGSYGLGLEFSVVSYGKPRALFCFLICITRMK